MVKVRLPYTPTRCSALLLRSCARLGVSSEDNAVANLVQPEPDNVSGTAALLRVLPFVGGLMFGVSAQPRFGKHRSHSTGRTPLQVSRLSLPSLPASVVTVVPPANPWQCQ